MSRTERSIVIRRPRADVFALVADPENDPRWHDAVVEAVRTSEGVVGVGSRFRLVHADAGNREELEGEITHYEPNERVGFRAWFARPRAYAARRIAFIFVDFRLEPYEGGTLLTRCVEWRTTGPLAVFDRWARRSPRADRRNDELLQRIKRLLEEDLGD
jgi:uncharacterized protein YndB with AHSA1/START domain